MRNLVKILFLFAIFLIPSLAHAQATLAGVVRDTSGAILPGVTVEAASPALIERVRSASTDGNGQYQIVDLRPGIYEITYTLSGFATVRREAIEVTGAGVITINIEMRVGQVTETINVTGETPVVDVQSTRHQAVLDTETINDLPAARSYGAILAAVPTLQGGGANSSASQNPSFFSVHGGPANEGRVQLDGLSVGAAFNGGGVSGNAYDIANAQEMQIILAGALGENETGGPVMNLVPKTGGNTFRGSIFGSGAGDWAQGNNLDAELIAQGVTEAAGLIKLWDVSFALGGPIKRDRLWFFANIRDEGQHTDIPGLYGNANAGNASRWDYVEDRNVKARLASAKTITSVRVTAQATPRNKVSFYYDYQWDCDQSSQSLDQGCRPRGEDWTTGSFFGSGFSPEAVSNYWDGREIISQVTWSSPVTNKLLLEAGYATFLSHWGWMKQPGAITDLVQVTQIAPFFKVYRAVDNMLDNNQNPNTWRASATYATGAHSLKFGYQGAYHVENTMDLASDPQMTITDLAPIVGIPGFGSATIRIAPWLQSNRTTYHSVYAQDQWTLGRFTLQGALRFDRAWSFFPADGNGAPEASRWNAAPISFPKSDGVTGYNDITPRAGVAWDVTGNGKTSLRVNIGKYLQSANNQENYTISNPALDGRNGRRGPNFQTFAARPFIDFNANHLPDCDMLSPAPNGECIAPLGNFANPNALTLVNPDVLSGWGVRPYDWQFGVTVQQEIVARTSVEVGYHRRWFRNFFLFDNINLAASDFDLVTLTAPSDPRLPDGGGYPVSYYIPKPGVNTANIQNQYTFASDYGDWTNYWHGVDAIVNARLQNGLVLQAGTSTGRAVTDNCAVVAQVPELLNPALTNPSAFPPPATQLADSCHKVESWQTQFRGLASYTIPRIDVLVSTIFRSQPNATFGFGATPEGNSTGLSANFATFVNGQAVNLNLLEPGVHYADRINVLDARFGKILRFGDTRTSIAVDFLNIFNANTGTAFQTNYGTTYLTPTAILNPRLARLNVTFDF